MSVDELDETQAAWAEWSDVVAGALPPNGYHAWMPAHDAVADHLGEEFWTARAVLAHIRQAAHARQRSAVAVLHVVLARVSAFVSHTLELPPIVGAPAPLCHFAALVARPGVGKSSANNIGTWLIRAPVMVPEVADQIPVGSGEGLVETLYGVADEDDGKKKVRRQIRFNAFVFADEGAVLADLGARSGSTLLPTLRTIWTGGTLGNANASEDRRRIVHTGQYTYGFVLAIQEERAGALLDDAASGTPQRFAWARATEPTLPDEPPQWPGAISWEPPTTFEMKRLEYSEGPYVRHRLRVASSIEAELRTDDLARARGQRLTDELDAHGPLLRLKIAALLALLERRLDVKDEDWHLAGRVKWASDATREEVVATIAREEASREADTSRRLARRHVEADEAVERRRVVDTARSMAKKVWDEPRRWARKDLRGALHSNRRALFEDALEHAQSEGWVTEHIESGQGQDRRAIRPGSRRPT